MPPETKIDTRQAIMDAGQAVVQARGYNALSFRELAKTVGIKSASIHYHFPTKGDLGAALAKRYTETAAAGLERVLAATPDASERISHYTGVFRAALLNDNRMCLVGIMAAEKTDLPAEVLVEVDKFVALNVAWLTQVLGLTGPDADAKALAVLSAVNGAQLMARGGGDVAIYDRTIAAYRTAGLLP
ncbi:TetR/AcrR family transcriptional regulator [Caulobacter soli]|uniref:TetR/AcrR family transcriptional regulator n=1 Tax=Caulobacter soli TaxID=2708539 RepID=UPI0013ECD3E5|nr:TetR/AcrR family transcriptional regulator [Caulobacter soli]